MKFIVASVVAAVAASVHADPPRVYDLNPDSRMDAFSNSISDDGLSVVGSTRASAFSQYHAYRWTLDGSGIVRALDLGVLQNSSEASDLSADGSVVVGSSHGVGFRWNTVEGLVPVTPLPQGVATSAIRASRDGRTILAYCTLPLRADVPYLWRSPSAVQELPWPAGAAQVIIGDLSADGRTVVGRAYVDRLSQPIVWSGEAGLPATLPTLGASGGEANAVSADGAVVVGTISGRPVRWTRDAAGAYELRPLPWMSNGRAWRPTHVSASGDVIGGDGYRGSSGTDACLWSRATGAVFLDDALRDLGADVSSWRFTNFGGFSADGSAATTYAIRTSTGQPRAVLIRGLPVPPPCGPDFNGDGLVDLFDYAEFVDAFEAGGPSADYSRDGFVDFFDYLDFVADFEAGC